MPFTPKGDVAEWRLVYDKISGLQPDEIVTVEELEEVLGRPLEKNRSPIYRAVKEMQRHQSRTLAPVRGVGYRVARADEHLGLALASSDRARNALKRGVAIADSTDRSLLKGDAAQRLDAVAQLATRAVEFLGVMAKQVDEHAKQIEAVKSEGKDTTNRVAALEETLKRHGLD
jgi:hypothetical protein